jgi:hypothetical protein
MYVVLAQIMSLKLCLYIIEIYLRTSEYNSYQQQMQMDTQSVITL